MRRFACRNFQITTNADSKLSYTPCYGVVRIINLKFKYMKQEKDLIEKWEKSGFLINKTYDEKAIISQNLEKACDFLLNGNYLDKFEQMVFPLIFRLTEKQNEFDVNFAIIRFHKKFIINGYDLNDVDEEIKYLVDFVDEYEF
jgi:hypothetical protein